MSIGMPIITTKVGGSKWIIRNGENGIYIKSKDSEMIVHTIHKIKNDVALRKNLGIKAHETFKELFTDEKVIEKFRNIVNTFLEEN